MTVCLVDTTSVGNSSNKAYQLYGVTIFPTNHPDIINLTEANESVSLHGDKTWQASYVMMDFFDKFPLKANRRVLDIGCGWGVLSCYLAKHTKQVTGLDADEAVESYYQFHADQNKVDLSFKEGTIESLTKQQLSHYEVIVGCDICFWDSLKQDWQLMIRRALSAGVKEIYITDPGRPPFWELVEYAEKHFAGEIWTHEISSPESIEQYVLEIKA